MWKYILLLLLAWMAYNLIFRFILPVYRASKQMKKGFNDFRQKMEQQQQHQHRGQQAYKEPVQAHPEEPKRRSGDYIDFEEVK